MKLKFLLSVLLIVGLAGLASAAPILYGITFSNELITINTATGAGSLVGPLSSAMSAFGLANVGSNLYAFDQVADRVQQLDPATGATIGTTDVGIAAVGEGGFTLDGSGLGFLSSSSGNTGTLWSVNLPGASSALIGQLSVSMDGLDLWGGTLYGISQDSTGLYTINTSTAAVTLVGQTGVSGSGIAGMAFRPTDGVLYWVASDGNLYTLNTVTGAATLIGATGFGVSGLAFLNAEIPEPSTFLLAGIGLCALALIRRKAV